MNKYVAVLAIIIVALGGTCAVLFHQIVDLQNRNSTLYYEKIVFRDMILEYQDQIAQLKSQISDLQNQIDELQDIEQRKQAELERNILSARQVKITGITFESIYYAGAVIADSVTVSVKNYGQNHVENLTLLLSRENLPHSKASEIEIKLLRTGEEKRIALSPVHLIDNPHWVATLWLEDIFLDEYYYWG